MKKMCILYFLMMSSLFAAYTPDQALQALKEGNERFQQDVRQNRNQSYIRKQTVSAQNPYCTILTCSDSRADPSLIFELPLGDLFVIRLAGNIASDAAIESSDYGAYVLNTPLVVVMGHQNCGAVEAIYKNDYPPKIVQRTVSLIEPFISKAKNLDEAIKENAKGQAEVLRNHLMLKEKIDKGDLKIVWAYYNFETGRVDFYE